MSITLIATSSLKIASQLNKMQNQFCTTNITITKDYITKSDKSSYFLGKSPTSSRNSINKKCNEIISKSKVILQFSTDKTNLSDASLEP